MKYVEIVCDGCHATKDVLEFEAERLNTRYGDGPFQQLQFCENCVIVFIASPPQLVELMRQEHTERNLPT